jgi:PmbA protein
MSTKAAHQNTDTTEQILTAAKRHGAQQAEVFHVANEETPVKFEANRLKELNARHTSGVALRVIVNGRIGFASSSRPGDVEDLVEAAIDTAPFGPEAEFDFPALAEAAAVEVYDPATESVAVDDLIGLGQSLVDAIVAVEPDIQCDAHIRRTAGTATLANSNGGEFSYRASMFSAWIHGTLIRGTDMLFVGDGDASCSPQIDDARIKQAITEQLERARTMASARTADLPVLFTSIGVADALLGPLTMAFNGRLVHQGQSPLMGQLGEEKYDRRVSLYDDATLSMRPASRPFDDEGTPSRRTPLIEKGVVRNFLYDLQTAGQARATSTGNAERAGTSQPNISTASILLETGDRTFADMVKDIKEGIVVEELMGAGQGNIMGGDFSGNVLLGYKIENGEIVGRVKNTIVAGNVHEALRNIVAIGSEARWVGGTVYAPPVLIEHLAVSSGDSG